jgi:hypothetical protein
MKKFVNKPVLSVGLIAAAVLFLSFTLIRGGDSYAIRLNNALLVQHYLTSNAVTPTFTLDRLSGTEELSVQYSECGKIGTERKLLFKDAQDNLLKEFRFANTPETKNMLLNAKDILALQKNGADKLKLYYTSREVIKERLLATITLKSTASSKR